MANVIAMNFVMRSLKAALAGRKAQPAKLFHVSFSGRRKKAALNRRLSCPPTACSLPVSTRGFGPSRQRGSWWRIYPVLRASETRLARRATSYWRARTMTAIAPTGDP